MLGKGGEGRWQSWEVFGGGCTIVHNIILILSSALQLYWMADQKEASPKKGAILIGLDWMFCDGNHQDKLTTCQYEHSEEISIRKLLIKDAAFLYCSSREKLDFRTADCTKPVRLNIKIFTEYFVVSYRDIHSVIAIWNWRVA